MRNRDNESGNIIFFILLGVVLIGLVTAAIRSGSDHGANIDREDILLKATQVREYASELERAVVFVLRNDFSELDIRFAHPDAHPDYGDLAADTTPENQVFHRNGGAANYRLPPPGIQFTSGGSWEFYGNSHLPEVGTTGRGDLIAVLPNVTQAFCDKINDINGHTVQPEDTSGTAPPDTSCIYAATTDRFDGGTQFSDPSTNNDFSNFTVTPAMQGCVRCTAGTGTLHFYHVLHAR